jgi:hypothetical protein
VGFRSTVSRLEIRRELTGRPAKAEVRWVMRQVAVEA